MLPSMSKRLVGVMAFETPTLPLVKVVRLLMPKRPWVQFSLGTMFIVVTALCLVLVMVADRAHRQRDAIAAIEALGGNELFDLETYERRTTRFPGVLRQLLGPEYTDRVQSITLSGTQVSDDSLTLLHDLPHLKSLSLRRTCVTDAGLAHIKGLSGLEHLLLDETQVTDAGLADLAGLSSLQELTLDGTKVGDSGLAHIQGLTRLQVLWLSLTQVTDEGMTHLAALKKLHTLSLSGTRVTPDGVVRLQRSLRNCEISR